MTIRQWLYRLGLYRIRTISYRWYAHGLYVIRFENKENYRFLRYKNGWGI